jgi:ATP-binding protein involved in chromosome partitioning
MTTIEKVDIENLLKNIIDPNVETDLVTARSVKSIVVEGASVAVRLELGYPAKSFIEGFKQQVMEQIKALEGVSSVEVDIKVNIVSHAVQNNLKPIANVKNIIAIASGKGGVGKSITTNMHAHIFNYTQNRHIYFFKHTQSSLRID